MNVFSNFSLNKCYRRKKTGTKVKKLMNHLFRFSIMIILLVCFVIFNLKILRFKTNTNCVQTYVRFFFLELFDHKLKGIFPILNDECKVREPNVENFTLKLRSSPHNPKLDEANSSLRAINWPRNSKNAFIIRHFAGNVLYSTVKPLFSVFYSAISYSMYIFF